MVTWSEGSSIKYQVVNANNSLTGNPQVTLNGDAASAASADSDPRITSIGADGSVVITWTGVDSNGDNSVFVQKLSPTGSIVGNPVVKLEANGVTTGADNSAKVTAVGNAGAYVVSWSGVDEGGDTSVYVQKFNVSGSPDGTATKLEAIGNTSSADTEPQVASTGTDGSYVVAWLGSNGTGPRVHIQQFKADGVSGTAIGAASTVTAT